MSRHVSFLLGQALEALTRVEAADTLVEAQLAATAALSGIVPAPADWPGVERGSRSPIGDGAGAPLVLTLSRRADLPAVQDERVATSTPAPSPLVVLPDPAHCGHVMGSLMCTRDAHPGNPRGHVYAHPSWVADRHQGAS